MVLSYVLLMKNKRFHVKVTEWCGSLSEENLPSSVYVVGNLKLDIDHEKVKKYDGGS